MIQRKQSLYLFLGACFGAMSIFFSLFTLTTKDEVYVLKEGFLQNSSGELIFFAWYFLPVLIAACLYSFVSIFRYKNLKKQHLAVKTSIVMAIGAIISMIAFIIQASTQIGGYIDFDFSPFVFGPVLLLAFNYMALKSIKNDIDLIKSVDRIR